MLKGLFNKTVQFLCIRFFINIQHFVINNFLNKYLGKGGLSVSMGELLHKYIAHLFICKNKLELNKVHLFYISIFYY